MEQSALTVGRSTAAEREEKLHRLRFLYLLFVLQLGVAILAAALTFCGGKWQAVGSAKLAVPAAVGCLGVLLLSYFLPMVRNPPISWGLYAVFVASFAVLAAWATGSDSSCLVYFWLWAVFGAMAVFAGFFLVSAVYPSTLASIAMILGGAVPALLGFLALSEAELWQTVLVFGAAVVFAFYIAYQHRAAVRNSLWDFDREEAVTGSVRLWLDGLLGLCRTAELFCRPISAFN